MLCAYFASLTADLSLFGSPMIRRAWPPYKLWASITRHLASKSVPTPAASIKGSMQGFGRQLEFNIDIWISLMYIVNQPRHLYTEKAPLPQCYSISSNSNITIITKMFVCLYMDFCSDMDTIHLRPIISQLNVWARICIVTPSTGICVLLC